MHANVYGLLDGVELAAVVDHKQGKREKYAAEFGVAEYATLAEALEKVDVDIVDICLPTHEHAKATIEAARAGKHVFCEKPMALTLEEADAMIDACQAAEVQLMIGHCIRFWPEYVKVKEAVDSRALGKLLSINLTRYGEFPFWSEDNWLADETKSGGGSLDMHIHDTDFILYLLGDPDEARSWGTRDSRGVSQIFTTMRYSDGAVAHLEGGWNLPSNTPFKMAFRAIFENGAMIMDGGPLAVYRPNMEPEVPEFPKMEAAGGGNISDLGGYYHELRYFVDRITKGQPLEVTTPESSRRSLAVTLDEISQV